MKKALIILNLIGIIVCSNAQVGINTSTPSSNAALDVNSQISSTVYGGLMPPKLTLTQRNAMTLTAADDGLMAYVSGFSNGDRCLQLFNGSTLTWESIQCFASVLTVFLENMGTVSVDTDVNTHQSNGGFANSASCTISSTTASQTQVRVTQLSTANFPSASGAGNLYFTSNSSRDFLIQNINVSSYTGPLTLQMLIYKNTNAATGSDLAIEYYNGSSWVPISYSLPTGVGTAIWHEKVLSTTIPNTITQIRITSNGTNPIYRIDDIKIIRP